MALKATIYKAGLEIVDMDRHYYETHRLTIACHPSETGERMMIRLLAFALNAHERLTFGKGISDHDEPDLWQKGLDGGIELWIELGHPDEKILSRALGRARKVVVYTYQGSPERWWNLIRSGFAMARNLSVFNIDPASSAALAKLAEKTMNLQCSIQEGEIWLRDDRGGEVRVGMQRAF